MVLGAIPARAATMSLNGALPQDLASGSVPLTVEIRGVTAAEAERGASDPQSDAAQLAARFDVRLPDTGKAQALPIAGDDDDAPLALDEYQDHDETTEADGSHTFKYYLEIDEQSPGALQRAVKDGKLALTIAFHLGGAESDIAPIDHAVLIQPTLETRTPDTPGSISGAGAIDVVWRPQAEAPATLILYVLDTTRGKRLDIPAREVSGVVGVPDQAATCTWSGDSATGDCVTCPDDGDYYLDAEAAAKESGILVARESSAAGVLHVAGLAPGKKYSLFLQYAAKGVRLSQCTPAYPY